MLADMPIGDGEQAEGELARQRALITGANAGIGAATVRLLAAGGVACAVHYLPESEADDGAGIQHMVPGERAARSLVLEVGEGGGTAVALGADLRAPGAASRLVRSAEEELAGPITVLVNNAAHCELPDDLLSLTEGSLARHYRINVIIPLLLMRAFAERLSHHGDPGGRVINVSTDTAQAFATQVGYGTSKAALEAATRAAARELGPRGVTVNCVAPGPVQTGWMTERLVESVLPSIPLGRVGTPEDIAATVAFLAGPEAGWITGQVIRVCGGHVM
jgi:3-oxoacyl-[acyl-carrier protein] reductase